MKKKLRIFIVVMILPLILLLINKSNRVTIDTNDIDDYLDSPLASIVFFPNLIPENANVIFNCYYESGEYQYQEGYLEISFIDDVDFKNFISTTLEELADKSYVEVENPWNIGYIDIYPKHYGNRVWIKSYQYKNFFGKVNIAFSANYDVISYSYSERIVIFNHLYVFDDYLLKTREPQYFNRFNIAVSQPTDYTFEY